MIDDLVDIIVVGSGAAGAQAAQSFVEAGLKVIMLDAGFTNSEYKIDDQKSFFELRKNDQEQYRYFLGNNFESYSVDPFKVGAHLAPSRMHIHKNVDKFAPHSSSNFAPFESLAKGGLGVGWGLGCSKFSKKELLRIGIDSQEIEPYYQNIANRIGISSNSDEIQNLLAPDTQNLLPPLNLDRNAKNLLQRYQKKKSQFNKNNIFLGQSILALLTKNKGKRKAFRYRDLEYYDDQDGSAYRPWQTIDTLREKSNFYYRPNFLVGHFNESSSFVEVIAKNIQTSDLKSFKAKKLFMACGALGTSRIILQSFNEKVHLPILTNPFCYIPFLNWRNLGKELEPNKSGMAQLFMLHNPPQGNSTFASIYSYRSLLLSRLVKDSPISVKEARPIFQYLQSALSILLVQHPDHYGPTKKVFLNHHDKFSGQLNIDYSLDENQKRTIRKSENRFLKTVLKLGGIPVNKISPKHGSSIHYAGTLPYSSRKEKFTLLPTGKLGQSQHVYVGDSSGFKFLPAKSLTWTIMANSLRVANHLTKELENASDHHYRS